MSDDNVKFKKLRSFNLFMAVLHFGQGIAILLLSSNFSLPVTSSFLKFNVVTKSLQPVRGTLFDLKIGPLVAAFLFLSAFFHLLTSLPGFNERYADGLKNHINKFRWVEYSFSSSLMIVVIAMLVGVYDIGTLIALVGANASMILFGWLMELHNQTLRQSSRSSLSEEVQASESKTGQAQKTNWTSFIMGCITGIVPWIVVAIYLFGSGDVDHHAPKFVYWIYFSIFLFFNSFAINQILQYKKVGKWSDYLYGERAYIILSLVAKSLLAWQVFAGTLRPM